MASLTSKEIKDTSPLGIHMKQLILSSRTFVGGGISSESIIIPMLQPWLSSVILEEQMATDITDSENASRIGLEKLV